jgi:hypothetical protein
LPLSACSEMQSVGTSELLQSRPFSASLFDLPIVTPNCASRAHPIAPTTWDADVGQSREDGRNPDPSAGRVRCERVFRCNLY